MEARHEPVLLEETIEALAIGPGDTVVDATIGGGGHFAAMLAKLGADGILVGIDADPAAVKRGREAYARDRRPERPVAHLVNDNFRNLGRILDRLGVGPADAILFDLGWSGYQLAAPRGFSFGQDTPLLMTYSDASFSTEFGVNGTAADIVNSAPEDALAGLIRAYGEERFARGIARAIVAARGKEHILTTTALVDAILAGTPRWYREGKTHPATRTFQALRIAVNDELNALREGLTAALAALSSGGPLPRQSGLQPRGGGRLAVISFHSVEDRIVKNLLRDAARAGQGTVSKKPIMPSHAEVLRNHRARSAKLRVFERAIAPSAGSGSASGGRVTARDTTGSLLSHA